MHSLSELKIESEEQEQSIQNAYLEAKNVGFRDFLVGGDYPFSDILLTRLKAELSGPEPKLKNLQQIFHADPVNSVRIISLAFSPLYFRSNLQPSILSVIQQFGLRRLPELITEVAKQKSYKEFFKSKIVALEELQRTLLTAELSRKIAAKRGAAEASQEEVLTVSAGMSLLKLLLAYSCPQLKLTALIEMGLKSLSFDKISQKLFLTTEGDFAGEFLSKMSFPQNFLEVFTHLKTAPWNKRTWSKEEHSRWSTVCHSVYIANALMEELLTYNYETKFYALSTDLAEKSQIAYDDLMDLVSELPHDQKRFEEALQVNFTELPGFIRRISKRHEVVGEEDKITGKVSMQVQKAYFSEIKEFAKLHTQTARKEFLASAVQLGLMMLVKVLKFDRACMLASDSRNENLEALMAFGKDNPLLSSYRKKLSVGDNDFSPEIQAYFEAQAVFNGDPLFEDAWPFVAFPLHIKGKTFGVFYADRASKGKDIPLSMDEQIALINLAELFMLT